LLEGRLIVVTEKPDDVLHYDVNDRPSDALYSHLLGVDKVEVVLYFKYIDENVWEIGLRGSHYSAIDVGAISATLNGGGHRKAAGATVEGHIDDIKANLVATIEEELNKL
ncbi:MAG: DHHA1 domain-containing protein, partial [Sphaerochaetaceae bacterium]